MATTTVDSTTGAIVITGTYGSISIFTNSEETTDQLAGRIAALSASVDTEPPTAPTILTDQTEVQTKVDAALAL